jgi:hypothetical protein
MTDRTGVNIHDPSTHDEPRIGSAYHHQTDESEYSWGSGLTPKGLEDCSKTPCLQKAVSTGERFPRKQRHVLACQERCNGLPKRKVIGVQYLTPRALNGRVSVITPIDTPPVLCAWVLSHASRGGGGGVSFRATDSRAH